MSFVNAVAGTSSGEVRFTFVYRKGGIILLHAGHEYCKKRKYNTGLEIWECTERKKNKCRGRLKIKDRNIIEEQPHFCLPNFAKNAIQEKIQECKDKLASGFPSVPNTHNTTVSELKDSGMDLIEYIPSFSNIKSSLYRHKNNSAGMKKTQFKNVEEFEVPPKYKDFLLADYYNDGNRILIFCIEEAKHYICEIRDFFCDGTFKCCTAPFTQLYSIHGDIGSTENNTNIVPLIYAYMTRRDVESYTILFNLIKSQIPRWEPRMIKIDFEIATIKAIKSIFPLAKVKGCFTHFKRAIWKKGRALKLTTSGDIYKIREVALTAVLPLLPESKVMNGWMYVTQRSTTDPDVMQFRKYVEDHWLRDDFFTVWCVFGERHRTTNAVEGWHNKINKAMGKKNPNALLALSVLKEDANFFLVRKMQLSQGINNNNKRKKKFILSDQFIHDMQMGLVNGHFNIDLFLERMRM